MDYSGQRIVIIGAARQGTALARYLSANGSQVVLTDRRSETELSASMQSLRDLPVEWALGDHPLELLDNADLVCLSGGVPMDIPLVKEAMRRGISLSNDSQIFLENTPCRVIGVTGSAGKTTVTTLLGKIAQVDTERGDFYRKVWVGGNIGNPLITDIDEMTEDDIAIMELSSFQLELMTASPQIAVVLNITPNHLDRHGNMTSYVASKFRILMYQNFEDIAVLSRDDGIARSFADMALGHIISFGMEPQPKPIFGTTIENDVLVFQEGTFKTEIMNKSEIQLRGEHNLMNVLAACATSFAAGFSTEAMKTAIREFTGVPHRLEFVRSYRGAEWYNDSIATSPERVLAAIRSFDGPIVLLAGGRDKDLPWEVFAEEVGHRVRELVLFGESAKMIESKVRGRVNSTKIHRCEGLESAVTAAAKVSQSGDIVLLAPGGTSFDEFTDFAERGEWYRKWVQQLK